MAKKKGFMSAKANTADIQLEILAFGIELSLSDA